MKYQLFQGHVYQLLMLSGTLTPEIYMSDAILVKNESYCLTHLSCVAGQRGMFLMLRVLQGFQLQESTTSGTAP